MTIKTNITTINNYSIPELLKECRKEGFRVIDTRLGHDSLAFNQAVAIPFTNNELAGSSIKFMLICYSGECESIRFTMQADMEEGEF